MRIEAAAFRLHKNERLSEQWAVRAQSAFAFLRDL